MNNTHLVSNQYVVYKQRIPIDWITIHNRIFEIDVSVNRLFLDTVKKWVYLKRGED